MPLRGGRTGAAFFAPAAFFELSCACVRAAASRGGGGGAGEVSARSRVGLSAFRGGGGGGLDGGAWCVVLDDPVDVDAEEDDGVVVGTLGGDIGSSGRHFHIIMEFGLITVVLFGVVEDVGEIGVDEEEDCVGVVVGLEEAGGRAGRGLTGTSGFFLEVVDVGIGGCEDGGDVEAGGAFACCASSSKLEKESNLTPNLRGAGICFGGLELTGG